MFKPTIFKHRATKLLIKQVLIKAPIALLALVLLVSLNCGKRKAPLPPTERVAQRVDLSGVQRGDTVLISWKMPARNAGKGSVLNVSRADIYRLAEPANSPLEMSEEEFANRSVLIGSVPIKDDDFGLKSISYRDQLEFAGQAARLRYAIRFVNASGQKAAFSNFLVIEPTANVAGAPTSLSAKVSQESVALNWTDPTANVNGSTPLNLLGYNIYRSTSDKEPGKLLNNTPVTGTQYSDEFFEFGKDYYYFVRSVSSGTGSVPIESSESNIVHVKPIDVFPPSAPAAITLAAGQNIISIFFAVNPEKDIAGYKIYRSADANKPKPEWEILTPELLKTNTFQDTRVSSGTRYYYYITAIDSTGNVSDPSEIVSELAP
jgi:fibronectin type 3 domain-containing protein